MANIKGFQLKAVKQFQGHEGEPLRQGNLYFNNKKAGFVSEDAHGGYPNISLDPAFRQNWTDASAAFLAESPEEDTFGAEEHLFYELFNLHEDETQFKKAIKKGYTMVAFYQMKQYYDFGERSGYKENGIQHIIQTTQEKDLAEYEASELKDQKYNKKVYTSLEDFIIA